MIVRLKKDATFRGFTFEVMAQKWLRKQTDNSYVFRCADYKDLASIIKKYKLNITFNISLLSKFFKTIDLIEFEIDYKTKVVERIFVYEVKTKMAYRKRPVDISEMAHNRYLELESEGFTPYLVMISLLDDWAFAINLFPLIEFHNFRLRENRFMFFNKKNAADEI